MGGVRIVQDPRDAMYDTMPVNAIRHAAVDHVVPAPPMEVDAPPSSSTR
jgi:chemotaxis response regulator CheB